jgi:hypothetical protein
MSYLLNIFYTLTNPMRANKIQKILLYSPFLLSIFSIVLIEYNPIITNF